MKENNEVMQGDNTARGPSASGADLSVGAVLSAKTKEDYRKAVYPNGEKREFNDVKKGDIFYVEEPRGEILTHSDGNMWMIADEDYEQNIIEGRSHVLAHYIETPSSASPEEFALSTKDFEKIVDKYAKDSAFTYYKSVDSPVRLDTKQKEIVRFMTIDGIKYVEKN